ncbi:hypothetical protein [Anaerostipes hadrus]|jgi:hypothetical protein|uniref:hypothetical protein n=1 Tax=Anaerostipes hadrus TaxID=649756 RepID=UPI00189A94C1|nr:hypothetical protein [Anaerostipes hadrus]
MEYIVEYRAVLKENKSGNILVEVPDLNIFCYGSSMTEAMDETERCITKECIERLILTQPLPMVTTKKEDLDSYILKNFEQTMVIPMFVKFDYFDYRRPTEIADVKEKAASLGESVKRLGSKLKKLHEIKRDTRKLKKKLHKESEQNLKEMKQIFDEWHGIIDKDIKGSKGRVDEILEELKNVEDFDEEE